MPRGIADELPPQRADQVVDAFFFCDRLVAPTPKGVGSKSMAAAMKSKQQLPDANRRLKSIENLARQVVGSRAYDVRGPHKGKVHSVVVRFRSTETTSAEEQATTFAATCAGNGIDAVKDGHVVSVDPLTIVLEDQS